MRSYGLQGTHQQVGRVSRLAKHLLRISRRPSMITNVLENQECRGYMCAWVACLHIRWKSQGRINFIPCRRAFGSVHVHRALHKSSVIKPRHNHASGLSELFFAPVLFNKSIYCHGASSAECKATALVLCTVYVTTVWFLQLYCEEI
jgi:hypothetical protein